MNEMQDIFQNYIQYLETSQKIKTSISNEVQKLDQFVWSLHANFEKVHNNVDQTSIEKICKEMLSTAQSAASYYEQIGELIPENEKFKYNYLFRDSTQKLLEIILILNFLVYDKLVTYSETAVMLNLSTVPVVDKTTCSDTSVNKTESSSNETETKSENENETKSPDAEKEDLAPSTDNSRLCCPLYLELEDYLMASLRMSSSITRLAINAISARNFILPVRINKFIKELNLAFALLHLKNSHLRKTYDELKYNVKKCEDYMYNLSLRGLIAESVSKPVRNSSDIINAVEESVEM